MRPATPLLLALLCGCGGDKDPTEVTDPDTGMVDPTCTDLTWESFGSGYVRTWCGPCHSSSLDAGERYGAPLGVNFDDLAAVRAQSGLVAAFATGDVPLMPPAGGPSEQDVVQLEEWLACSAPGQGDTAPDPCAKGELDGDLVLDGADACADISSVTGDVHVAADVPLDCLCNIGGDLVVDPGVDSVVLGELESVAGSIVLDSADALTRLELPDLDTLGGGLVATDRPLLEHIELGRLDTVGMSLVLMDNPMLANVHLPQLLDVAGHITVAGNPLLHVVELSRLTSTGSELRFANNPSLATISGDFYEVRTIGGSLVFDDNPALLSIYGFNFTTAIGGDVQITGNHSISEIFGFDLLETLPGSLIVSDNDQLQVVQAFQALGYVDGSLWVEDNATLLSVLGFDSLNRVGSNDSTTEVRIARNPRLAGVSGLDSLVIVQGLELVDNAFVNLTGFSGLTEINGDLEISDNGDLQTILALQSVALISGNIEVRNNPNLWAMEALSDLPGLSGSLRVESNPDLEFWTPPSQLQSIQGDLVVDTTVLPTIPAFANLTSIGGSMRLIGNASATSIDAMSLADIGGDLEVTGLGANELGGLGMLADIGGTLWVHDNANLTQVTDLAALDTVGGDLRIIDNAVLPTQQANELVTQIGVGDIGGTVEISGNL